MYKDRVIDIDKYRQFASILGSLKGIRDRFDNFVSRDTVLEYSTAQAAKIKEYMDAITEDVSGLKIIDLFDPEFLDNDLYDDGLVFTQSIFMEMRNSVRLLNELRVAPQRTVVDLNEANRVVSNEILPYAMVRLLTDYQTAIKEHDVESLAVKTIEEATRDQVVQVVTPDFYLREIGVEVPENIDSIFSEYEYEYNEFVDGRVEAILTSLLEDLDTPAFIVFQGVSEFRSKLAEIFAADQEVVDYYNTVDPSKFIYDTNGTMNKAAAFMSKLPSTEINEVRTKVMEALRSFIDSNKFGDFEVQGPQDKRPLLRTVAMVDILLHAFVLASADVWDVSKETEEQLEDTTQYVVTLINVEISNRLVGADEDIGVSEYTAYRFLSCVSVANDLVVARNAVLRWRLPSWGTAISTLGTILLQMFNPEKYEEQQKAKEEYFSQAIQQGL